MAQAFQARLVAHWKMPKGSTRVLLEGLKKMRPHPVAAQAD
jgi:hypothetical protein